MQAIYNAMLALLALPEMAFFTNYRDDFLVHDRRELINWGAPGADYLWIVRSNGTHLSRLGIHPSCDKYMEAALDSVSRSDPAARVFRVSSRGIRELTFDAAKQLLAHTPHLYTLKDHQVLFGAGIDAVHLATLALQRTTDENLGYLWSVEVTSDRDLGLNHLVALRELALASVVKASGSLLVSPWRVTINGVEITAAVEDAQRAQSSCVSEPSVTLLKAGRRGARQDDREACHA